jgi:hypothetical protein
VGGGFALEQTEVRDRFAGLYLQQGVRKNLIKLCGHSPFAISRHEVRRCHELRRFRDRFRFGMDSGPRPFAAGNCLPLPQWS